MKRRNFLQCAGAATTASALGVIPSVYAQAFPSKPIRIICPYPPGATTDAVSRLMANALQSESGATVIVDNRSGAGGNIGTEAVARGEPDGYTLLLGALGPLAANPALYPKLNFDPAKDFTPLALAASVPLIWAVHPSFPATTVKEALELLRKNPGKFSYASAGNGTPQHLAGELVKRQTGTSILHIPYRGSAPALNDVLGGTVQMGQISVGANRQALLWRGRGGCGRDARAPNGRGARPSSLCHRAPRGSHQPSDAGERSGPRRAHGASGHGACWKCSASRSPVLVCSVDLPTIGMSMGRASQRPIAARQSQHSQNKARSHANGGP